MKEIETTEIEQALRREREIEPSKFILDKEVEIAFLPYDDQGNYMDRE